MRPKKVEPMQEKKSPDLYFFFKQRNMATWTLTAEYKREINAMEMRIEKIIRGNSRTYIIKNVL